MKNSSDSAVRSPKLKCHSHNLILHTHKKARKTTVNEAHIHVKPLGLPLISKATGLPCDLILLQPNRPCTIGRDLRRCDFIFSDRRVSKKHLQLIFVSFSKKIYLSDGIFSSRGESAGISASSEVGFRVSLNGVYVNAVRIGKGEFVELDVGDVVSLVCGSEGACDMGIWIGFYVKKVAFTEEVTNGNLVTCRAHKALPSFSPLRGRNDTVIVKSNVMRNLCREILCSNHPVPFIRKCVVLSSEIEPSGCSTDRINEFIGVVPNNNVKIPQKLNTTHKTCMEAVSANGCQGTCKGLMTELCQGSTPLPKRCSKSYNTEIKQMDDFTFVEGMPTANGKRNNGSSEYRERENMVQQNDGVQGKDVHVCVPPPGKKFYLNRIQFMGQDQSDEQNVVSLPELLYPVENIVRMFIATFTCDVSWFLSYCQIPANLPVTIACHNAGRCWSSKPDSRTLYPYSEFPNLVIVYPLFPEIVAFGKERKKMGIACHHPKLLVLQKKDSLRVVITSANLVAKQWLSVTNTVWWQDFPLASIPDYTSFFSYSPVSNHSLHTCPDFGAQLARFMASLVIDVPSQAHWLPELAKFDFKGALGHLVASIPGVYSCRNLYTSASQHFLGWPFCSSSPCNYKLLGTVESSVVGLSRLFRSSTDSRGAQLRKLASFLRRCHENVNGMSEIVLSRDTNIPADSNAVSVHIPNHQEVSPGESIQLGFLPKDVAKWVAPLSDSGLFAFSAYIYPKEVLSTILEGTNYKIQLVLYVFQGSSFSDLPEVLRPELAPLLCSLVASTQMSVGLWRLQEVLGLYRWPECSETDFIFGSSSIGSLNAQFIAAFSAAAGKHSLRSFDSQESDPEWGCWSASQELRNPSIKILFPTIDRVKTASCGIWASRSILCFSEKTWQKLRNSVILHDAVPFPESRIMLPMHVKVGRRRFISKVDSSAFGWVYCGSHNFSAAAWGRPLLGSRLHICNYELGIIFVVPPPGSEGFGDQNAGLNLDSIGLPFVVPAPKYRSVDRPATGQAMREAWAELCKQEKEMCQAASMAEEMEEMPEEEDEELEPPNYMTAEKEDERAYAEKLWSQVESSQSC